MNAPWHLDIVTPALLRHGRTTYGVAMRRALDAAGYDDIPANGLYVIARWHSAGATCRSGKWCAPRRWRRCARGLPR